MTGEQRDDWCPQEELAVGWAMHSLEPDEEAQLRAHLPGCARCSQAVRATEEVTAALGGSVRQYDPPARLKSRLMEAIEQTPQEVAPEHAAQEQATPPAIPIERHRGHKSGSTGRRLLAAAAIVVVLAGVGVAGVRFSRLSDQVAAQQQRNDELSKALVLAASPDTNRAVLRSPSGDELAIVLSAEKGAAVMEMDLKPNQSDHTYVVWGTSTPKAVPLATFNVSSEDDGVRLLSRWSADAHKHTGFAISLEPGQEAPPSPTEANILAAGQVRAS
ncbi:anti-sigma factor RsiW [Saccharothrix tamanrassetensis]|uniref:Regulator of SigK n=1 Tax=Saccharothrix tamanrassetensis TaxID=1051531 RepID=A0A841CWT4_9PSEU|nr:anti-sigma factor [Saccharothrix tamanrassetensis]MBB5960457.1 anti-sigma factor RsiW [Saccharothrix tamanrassetensis]